MKPFTGNTFPKTFSESFKHWMQYDCTKMGKNKLVNLNFWHRFQEVVASRGDFLHPDFPSAYFLAADMWGCVYV